MGNDYELAKGRHVGPQIRIRILKFISWIISFLACLSLLIWFVSASKTQINDLLQPASNFWYHACIIMFPNLFYIKQQTASKNSSFSYFFIFRLFSFLLVSWKMTPQLSDTHFNVDLVEVVSCSYRLSI